MVIKRCAVEIHHKSAHVWNINVLRAKQNKTNEQENKRHSIPQNNDAFSKLTHNGPQNHSSLSPHFINQSRASVNTFFLKVNYRKVASVKVFQGYSKGVMEDLMKEEI